MNDTITLGSDPILYVLLVPMPPMMQCDTSITVVPVRSRKRRPNLSIKNHDAILAIIPSAETSAV